METSPVFELTDADIATANGEQDIRPGDIVWYVPPGTTSAENVHLVVVTSLTASRKDTLLCVPLPSPAILYGKARLKI